MNDNSTPLPVGGWPTGEEVLQRGVALCAGNAPSIAPGAYLELYELDGWIYAVTCGPQYGLVDLYVFGPRCCAAIAPAALPANGGHDITGGIEAWVQQVLARRGLQGGHLASFINKGIMP